MKKALIIGLLASLPAIADTITIRADIWCPWNCDPFNESPGFMIEVAKQVFEAKGHSVDYKVMDWDEAVKATREGKNIAVPGATKDDAQGFVFPDEAQGMSTEAIYMDKSLDWKYAGPDSLKGLGKMAFNDGYEYTKVLMDHKKNNPDLIMVSSGDKPLMNNIVNVKKKKVNAFLEDPAVYNYTVKVTGMKVDHIKYAGVVADAPLPIYLAFSPKHPKSKEYAKILSDGVAEMRKSGQLEKILSKYGLKDWK